jgi:hypothetical protein
MNPHTDGVGHFQFSFYLTAKSVCRIPPARTASARQSRVAMPAEIQPDTSFWIPTFF